MSKSSAFCGNEVKTSKPKGKAGQVTISRLHELGLCVPPADGLPETAWLASVRRGWLRIGRIVRPPLL